MTAPAVSVVLPVRDGAAFIDEAIASVLEQAGSPLELVVVDDASSDDTPVLVGAWRGRDPRVHVVSRPVPGGIARALNDGVAHSSGQLIARLDADDRARPDRLRRQADEFARRPALAVLGTGVRYIDRAGRVLGGKAGVRGPSVATRLRQGNAVFHPSVMMRRSAFEAVGGYRAELEPAEDLDLWLRIVERHEVDNLEEFLTDYRVHEGQVTIRSAARAAAASTVAHWAADVRAAGRPDPVEGDSRPHEELLRGHGVDPHTVVHERIAAHRWAAELCEMAGYEVGARAAWRAARDEAASLGTTSEGLLLLSRARTRLQSGRALTGRLDQVRALTVAPGLVRRALTRRAQDVLRTRPDR